MDQCFDKGLNISFLLFELHLHANVQLMNTQMLFIQNDHYFSDMFSCLPQHAQREILLQAAGRFMHSFQYFLSSNYLKMK